MQTTGDPDPREVIGAIFVSDGTNLTGYGTGAFIGDGTVVLTCEHVIRGAPKQIEIGAIIGDKPTTFPLTVLEADSERDLALLRVHGHTAPNPLQVAFDTHVSYNAELVALEYAQTERIPTGHLLLNPAFRRGNKTRNVNLPKLGAIAGTNALELSFPALAGASGAPVLFENMPWTPPENALKIVGVLAANNTFRALAGTPGEFLLPQGVAINVEHLKPMYQKVFGSLP